MNSNKCRLTEETRRVDSIVEIIARLRKAKEMLNKEHENSCYLLYFIDRLHDTAKRMDQFLGYWRDKCE